MVESVSHLPGYHRIELRDSGPQMVVYRGIREHDRVPVIIAVPRYPFLHPNELIPCRHPIVLTPPFDHPNLVKYFALEPYQQGYALVMEDFGGIALLERMTPDLTWGSTPPTVTIVCQLALQIVAGLAELHRHGITHQHLQPATILINPDTHQVKLTGFSLASCLPCDCQRIQAATTLDEIPDATLAYLSPEQTGRMKRRVDYRSDFYALGVTMYQVLTGQLPIDTDDPMALMHDRLTPQPAKGDRLNPSVLPMLSDIVLKLMAKNAEDRYQSCLELTHDLQRCQTLWEDQDTLRWFPLGERDVSDRVLMSEQLYGREAEVTALLSAFNRASSGSCELLLVTGCSGIGKTRLINELPRSIGQHRGHFIQGRFTPGDHATPLSALMEALGDLMRQLLRGGDASVQIWRTKILTAIGPNSQVLIEWIPELEQIIGPQPAAAQPVAAEISGIADQHRWVALLQPLLQVFISPEHPLVIALHDWQWADPDTLTLIHRLITEFTTGYLLILGTYPDHDISAAQPLRWVLEAGEAAGITVTTIPLAPLTLSDLTHLVADTLHCDPDLAQPLAHWVYQKTQGNPFFATQVLQTLHQAGLITFNEHVGHWHYNLGQVQTMALTDNVVKDWHQPLRQAISRLLTGYTIGQEVGDPEFSAYCAYLYTCYAYFAGKALPAVQQEFTTYRAAMAQGQQPAILNWHTVMGQSVMRLMGTPLAPLNCHACNPTENATLTLGLDDRLTVYSHISQLIPQYILGNYAQAAYHTEQAQGHITEVAGLYFVPLVHFYHALIQISLVQTFDPKDLDRVLAQVTASQATLASWATQTPQNHQHQWQLVEAEKCRLLHHHAAAIAYYDLAIAGATDQGFIQEAALANELAAKFYLAWGKKKVAAGYMQEAYDGYAHWGANAKTDDLEHRYPQLLVPRVPEPKVPVPNVSVPKVPAQNPDAQLGSAPVSVGDQDWAETGSWVIYQLQITATGQWQITYISPGCVDLFEVQPDTILTDRHFFQRLIHPEDLPRFEQSLTHSAQTLAPWQWVGRVCLPSGQVKRMQGVAHPERLPQGTIVWHGLWLASSETIPHGAQQQVAATLQEQQDRLQLVMEASNLVIWKCNLVTGEEFWSPQAEALLGFAPGTFDGKRDSFLSRVHPEDLPIIQQSDAVAMQTGILRDEFRIVLPDQTIRWIYCLGKVYYDEMGTPIQIVGVDLDITERKTAEQALQIQRDFNQLIAEITSRFVDVNPQALDAEIDRSLHLIGELTQVDTSYRFIFDDDACTMSMTHEWSRLGCLRHMAQAQAIPQAAFPWHISKLKQRDMLYVPNVATLPPEAAIDQASWQPFNLVAVLAVPLIQNSVVIGFMGFASLSREMTWSDDIIRLLQILGQTITSAQERVQAEQHLSESEERLRLALAATNQGLFDLNLQTGAAIVSPEYATMLCYDPVTFQESHSQWMARLHPDDREQTIRIYNTYVAGDSSEYKVEYRQRTQTGDYKWILSLGKIVAWDADGHPLRMLGTHADISDRKQAEQQIQQQQQFLHTVIDTVPNLIFVKNDEGRYLLANQAMADIYGLDVDALMGKTMAEVHPYPEEVEQFLQQNQTVIQSGQPLFIPEERLVTAQGHEVWLQWQKRTLLVPGQEIPCVLGVGVPITIRKQAELTIQRRLQQEQALSRVFQAIRNSLDLDVIFATATAETSQLLNGLECCVVQYLPEQDIWQHVAEFRSDPHRPSLIGLEIPDHDNPFAEQLKRQHLVRVEATDRLDDPINQTIAQTLPGAWLLIPLVVDDRIWGSFTLNTLQQPFAWTEEQIRIAQTVAEQLEVAIQQAELYQQVEQDKETLLKSQTALIQSQQIAQLGNWELEVATQAMTWSDSLFRIFGFDPDLPIPEFAYVMMHHLHPEDRPRLDQAIARAMTEGTPYEIDLRFFRADGSMGYMEARAEAIRNHQGEIVKVFGTSLDISDRKAVEEAVRVRAQQQSAVAQLGQLALAAIDLAALMDTATALVAEHLGVDYCKILERLPDGTGLLLRAGVGWRPGLVGQAIVGMGADSQASYTLSIHDPVIVENLQTDHRFNGPALLQDHQVVSGVSVIIPGRDCPFGVIGAHSTRRQNFTPEDINFLQAVANIVATAIERQQAEEALRNSEAELRAVLAAMTAVVVVRDAQGRCLKVAPTNAPTFYQPPAELLGKTVHETFPTAQAEMILHGIQAALATHQTMEIDYCLEIEEDLIWFTASISPMTADSVVIVARDISDRKQAEQALNQQQRLLQLVLDTIPQQIFWRSREMVYLGANRRWAETVGLDSPDEIVGKTVHDVFHPEVAAAFSVEDRQIMTTGVSILNLVEQRLNPDGSTIWLEVNKVPIVDPHHGVIGILGCLEDISDRKVAEEALQESEERFRQLAENIQEVFWMMNIEFTQVLYISPTYETVWGRTCASLYETPQSFTEAIHPDDRDRTFATIQQCWNQGWDAEYRILRPDGSQRWIWEQAFPVLDADGQVQRIVGICQDISDRKQADQQLRASLRALDSHFDNSLLAIIEWDKDRKVTRWSKQAEHIFGWSEAEIQAMSIPDWQFVYEDDVDRVVSQVAALRNGSVSNCRIQNRNYRKDGTVIICEWNSSTIFDEAGNFQSMLSFAQDITEAKRDEALRQQAEEALSQERNLLSRIMETSPVGIVVLNSTGQLTFANDRAEQILGLTNGEAIGRLYNAPNWKIQNFDGSPFSESQLPFVQVMQTAQVVLDVQHAIEWPNGKRILVSINAAPLFNDLGYVDSVVVTVEDITDRKAAELALQQLNDELELRIEYRTAALQASEARFRSFFDVAPIGIAVADVQTYRFTAVNQAFCQLLGYNETELLTLASCLSVSLEEDWDAERPHATALFSGEIDVYQIEKRYIKKSGDIIIGSLTTTVLRDQAGQITHFLGMVQDITQRKHAEEQLRQSDAHLRVAQRIAKLGSWEFDIQAERITWSEEIFRIFGLDPTAGPPSSFADLQQWFHPDDRDLHAKTVQTTIATAQAYDEEFRICRPDGTLVYIQVKGEVILETTGQVGHLMGTVLDITDRKLTEQKIQQTAIQLAAANKELESFSYSISHDLRAPLRHIHGFVNALQQRLRGHAALDDPKVVHYMQVIESSGQKMALLIDGLLTFSRIGRKAMNNHPVPLRQLVDEAIVLIQSNPEITTPIEFVIGDLPIVQGDIVLLQQVLSNLISNAVKFSGHNLAPRIEIGQLPNTTIFIRDNGVGFDMKYADKLFGAFQRLHAQTDFEGTGIGLAIVQRIIHRHGGQIWAESQPDQGATFYFTLGDKSVTS